MQHLYDEIADSYDTWYATPKGRIVDKIEREALYAYLQPRAGLKLIDIGCGTGQYSLDLAGRGLEVCGVDVSPAMLIRARANAAAAGLTASFMEADALCLPFGDKTFDLALSVTALEFVPDLPAALREAYRLLKAGGRLVVGLIGRNSSWEQFYTEKARRNPSSVFNRARFYTLDELLSAMPGNRVEGRSVLFVPPDFEFSRENEAMVLENAAVCSGRTDGGFICAVAVK